MKKRGQRHILYRLRRGQEAGLRAHALSRSDTDLLMLLFETYGGWSEPVVRLFRRMQDKVRNKLTKRQYENEVSWSTSTWLALALHVQETV